MIFLILAILSNCAETIIIRFSERNLHNRYAVTMFNYMITVMMSYFFIGGAKAFSLAGDHRFALFLGVWNGALFVTWLLIYQVSIRHNGVPMSATFAKLGILLPTAGSVVFFAENPSLVQIMGIIIALSAIVLFYWPEKSRAGEAPKPGFRLLLMLVLLIGGMGDFNSKIFEHFGNPRFDGLFLFYTFLVSLILSMVVWLVQDKRVHQRDVLFGVLIGVPNQLTTMFLLWAIMRLPAYLVFPIYSVSVILLVSLISSLLFKEKLSRLQCLSMILVCVALVFLNI
ncbi:EamA family transporter [Candidatus Formimonas warabiya]|uniref:EamA domain-containing protein n=1 Tax=Formimonas warabiya TaxID=1761012 RepID=A0A3G1KY69_FORW1|nr:EamA family transporter [Candidatus Formimonas warabiya]ATW27434.1 hypothetical protein DCMF_24155 [Candidatus Formimonas warabiya]